MSLVSELLSWSWILRVWIVLYPFLLVIGILVGPTIYWSVMLVGVPLVVIPLTYRYLVGGGCSLRFQICALVKGMLAGFVFYFLSIFADYLVWQFIGSSIGWNALSLGVSSDIHFVWFFSGIIGGFGARIVEVRGNTRLANITIVGFE